MKGRKMETPITFEMSEEEIEKENDDFQKSVMASECTCGAWQFNDDGDIVHCADCVCGSQDDNFF